MSRYPAPETTALTFDDVNLTDGRDTANFSEGRKHAHSGALNTTTNTSRDNLEQTWSQGTMLSGNVVAVKGENITITGSNVVSDTRTVLMADNNITVQAGTNTSSESHFKQKDQSGWIYNGAAAVMTSSSRHLTATTRRRPWRWPMPLRAKATAQPTCMPTAGGTIVTRNTLNILADSGYKNPALIVAAFGPAVRPGALVYPMVTITGADRVFPEDRQRTPGSLYYFSNPANFVATFVGGTLFGSPYLDNNNTAQHLPGAAPGEFWGAVKGIKPVFDGPVNPHSCYGLNCAGTSYNWTEQKAADYKKQPSAPTTGGRP